LNIVVSIFGRVVNWVVVAFGSFGGVSPGNGVFFGVDGSVVSWLRELTTPSVVF
jgi:hypothetical protein